MRFLESRLLSPLPFSPHSFDRSLRTHLLRTRHHHPLEDWIVVPPFPPMAEAGRKMTGCCLLLSLPGCREPCRMMPNQLLLLRPSLSRCLLKHSFRLIQRLSFPQSLPLGVLSFKNLTQFRFSSSKRMHTHRWALS